MIPALIAAALSTAEPQAALFTCGTREEVVAVLQSRGRSITFLGEDAEGWLLVLFENKATGTFTLARGPIDTKEACVLTNGLVIPITPEAAE